MAVGEIRESIIVGLEQTKPAKMGLETLVFGDAMEETFDTETVSVDMFDGTRGYAKYTARKAKGQTLGLEGWTTVQVTPPNIDEKFVITAQDLKKRDPGESNVNAPLGGKFQKLVNRQLTRQKNRKQLTYNKQIKELITAGTVTIVEYDDKGSALATRTEDFKMPATHIYTVGTAWNATGADIWGDMRTIDELIIKDSGLTPDRAIVGKTTIVDMLNDTTIQKLLDNRRVEFGNAFKQTRADGLIYWGVLDGKEIYEFQDFDENGDPIIPASAYIPFASTAEKDIYYGSQDVIDESGNPAVVESKEVAIEDVDKEAVAKSWRFKSAKLFALTQSAAFGHLTTR
jgi:phosphohistidine swiveling domain-containing protein